MPTGFNLSVRKLSILPIWIGLLDQHQIRKHAMDCEPEAVDDLGGVFRFDSDQDRLIGFVIGLEPDTPDGDRGPPDALIIQIPGKRM